MTYSIVYCSRTGNTAKLADEIRELLPAQNCVYCGKPDQVGQEAEFIFAGFWTDKGSCSEDMKEFFQGLSGQKVFLFGTAGFGGSEEYFSRILGNVAACIPATCQVVGTFMCQGRMPEAVKRRYEGMLSSGADEESVRGMIENFERAKKHPDEKDLEMLRGKVKGVWEEEE